MKKKITFTWDLHWKCNYRCPYCWWDGKWDEFEKRNIYPGVKQLISVWKRIYDLYGCCHLDIVGGEPSIYPEFEEFVLKILKYHTVSIMTNLSGNFDKLINSKSKDIKTKFKMVATFHPIFSDFSEFLAKAKKIKKSGININIAYLAYPSQIKDIPEYRKIFFNENKFYFSVLTFWGKYNGKQYPDSYTDEENKIIEISIGKRKGEKYQTVPLVTKDKMCNAGHTYVLVHPDGEVLPCGGAGWEGKQTILGNIFDPNFKLLDGPAKCPSQHCPCNEWSFLLVDKKNNNPRG